MRTVKHSVDSGHHYQHNGLLFLYNKNEYAMSENIKPITTLHNLLDYDASKFTSAEIHLRSSLPEWIHQTHSLMLKTVLEKYLHLIKAHIKKMETFFEQEDINALSLNNRIMQAFIDETNEKMLKCTDPEIKDACLLACIQNINHYKISTYGTAAAFANALKMEKHTALFFEAEGNEKQIDNRLSQLAVFEINKKAKAPFTLNN
jgi:ferritin-like metal-binding protein YciE